MTRRTRMANLGVCMLGPMLLSAQSLNVIYSFGHNELGYHPYTGITPGPNGELYGTTQTGGAWGNGVLYELVPPTTPGGVWAEVVLHSFNSQNGDTSPPQGAGLLLRPSGVLYGVTDYSALNGGTVFQLQPPSGTRPRWREVALYAFNPSDTEGAGPAAAPVFGPHNALYGVTTVGGPDTSGTVYRLLPPSVSGGAWTKELLYSFLGKSGDGINPTGPLALATKLVIYGVTASGGAYIAGSVFRLAPPTTPGGAWVERLLHSFGSSPDDPGSPNGVVLGANGVLYGSARQGPLGPCNACGSVFELIPPTVPGGPWTEAILHAFTGGNFTEDGSQPNSIPVIGPHGELYGTTWGGGIHEKGTIYKLEPPSAPGGSWTETVVYTFAGGADGGAPIAVAFGPDGNLYGTTNIGGVSKDGVKNQGVVFQLVLPQNAGRGR